MREKSTIKWLLFVFLVLAFVAPSHAGLVDNLDSTITDTDRGLMYYDFSYFETDGDGLSCIDAENWADGLSYLGYKDWRLPSAYNSDGSGPCSGGGCSDSELGHLHLVEGLSPQAGVYGPFNDLQNYIYYKTPTGWIYAFQNLAGNYQHTHGCFDYPGSYAMAVRDYWKKECVDCPGTGIRGLETSVAVDSNNKVHIAYLDYTNDILMYATNAGGSWSTSIVDNSVAVDWLFSMALDSNNKAHIAYNDINEDFWYATNVTGSWVRTSLDPGTAVYSSSITVDNNDKVHISYYNTSPNWNLKYATNETGSWVYSTIDSGVDMGKFSSIATDSNNKVHISYKDSIGNNLWYATNAGVIAGSGNCSASADFDCATVDSGGDVTDESSLVVDSNDKVHIVFYHWTPEDLMYATNVTGAWVISPIDVGADEVGWENSLAIDSNDKLHVSYYDWTNGDLKYATDSTGSWEVYLVDTHEAGETDDRGSANSIAVDSYNHVHMSYFDDTNDDLRYVTNAVDDDNDGFFTEVDCNDSDISVNPGATENQYNGKDDDCNPLTLDYSWIIEVADPSTTDVRWTSVAMDSLGNIHISYRDDTTLKYATNASGTWVTTALDGGLGGTTSIAIDSADKVHISYYKIPELAYMTNASGSWLGGRVDQQDGRGQFNSIAVDSLNNIHIIYSDQADADLRYLSNRGVTPGSGNCLPGSNFDCEMVTDWMVGLHNSIAVDSADNLHISFISNSSLTYATNAGVTPGAGTCPVDPINGGISNFDCDTVSPGGFHNSIALDSEDNAHISFVANNNLTYATNESGGWVSVDVEDTAGDGSSIAIDSEDNVHISYYDGTFTALKYATNKGVAPGSGFGCLALDFYCITVIAATADPAVSTSVTTDSSDFVHIGFKGSLNYATNAPDADGDGFTSNQDCDDSDENTFPGAAPNDAPFDNACMKDTDGDDYGDDSPPDPGIVPGTDCNDNAASANPGNSTDATCNGVDDDCDGANDDDYVSVPTACGTGVCASTGVTSCVGGFVQDSCTPGPQDEPFDVTCDGFDGDCDGPIDEDFSSTPTSCGAGACEASGTTICISGAIEDTCTPGTPTTETCNAIDDDC
jgi:hypothetical protein